MAKMKSTVGGGPNSKQVVNKPVKFGAPNRAMNPGAVAQFGAHLGNPQAIQPLDAGPALPGTKLGNEVAKNVGKGGPGTGRTVSKPGSQGHH
jgi:hypothetical protein